MAAGRRPLREALWCLLVVSVAGTGLQVAMIVEGGGPFVALLSSYALLGLAVATVGVWLWDRRPSSRTGLLLVVTGILVLGASLANTGNRWGLLVGFLLAEAPIAALVHLLVAFPTGLLRDRLSRFLVAVSYLSSLAWQVPLFVYSPESAVFPAIHREGAAALHTRLDDLQGLIGGAVLIGAAWVVYRRWRAARMAAERRVLGLVFGYGIFVLIFLPLSARVLQPAFDLNVIRLFELQITAILGVPFVFAAAIVSGGLARTVEVGELALWLGRNPVPQGNLREALAFALGDPRLQLVYELEPGAGHVDADGVPVALPPPDSHFQIVEVEGPTGRAVIVYDSTLNSDPEPVRAAGQVVALAIDHERLTAELLASEAEIRRSRLRILEHGEEQRRQLAQDLHDGIQGRLVVAALNAGRLAAGVGSGVGPDDLAIDAARLRDELDAAITELRHLVQGVMPPVLIDRGLYAAVEDLADRTPTVVRFQGTGHDRELPWSVATAGYFIVAEAVANALKHARAEWVDLKLTVESDRLEIRIGDDGVGGATRPGTGLRGIADRVAAIDGHLRIDSPIGRGTTIEVELPCVW